MLILPVGDNTGRRTLPLVCIVLILVNTIIFAVSSHQDSLREPPLTEKQLTGLAHYEAPLLLKWLSHRDSGTYADALTMNDQGPELLFAYGWFDQAFNRHVHDYWADNPPPSQWQAQRETLEQWINGFSFIRWGLVPDAPSTVTFISSMFMHGDWFHLLGNMIWLVIFGISMERYWGGIRFSIAYLLAGLGAGALFILVDPHSGTPLVGASGAISGVMGLYAGTYRLRKVEFFYSLGFVFGSFKAPALVLFPVWLGWELLQAATADSNVAYMAHAGGLITGLVLALLLPHTRLATNEQDSQAHQESDREVPESCLKLAEELRFSDAQQRSLQWLEKYPYSRALWTFYLEMGQRQQQLDGAMKQAMKNLNGQQGSRALIGWLWQEYESLGGNIDRLPPPFRLMLAELAWHQNRPKIAKNILLNLQQQSWRHPRMEQLSEKLEIPT